MSDSEMSKWSARIELDLLGPANRDGYESLGDFRILLEVSLEGFRGHFDHFGG